MRNVLAVALLLAACQSAPEPKPQMNERAVLHPRSKVDEKENDAFVHALREEYQALGRIQAVLRWYSATQGETSLTQLTYIGHDRLFRKTALEAIAAAQQKPGLAASESQALTFLRRTLTGEIVELATAKFDDEYADAEAAATVALPWKEKPVAYRDLQNLIAQEPDAERRQLAFAAMNAVRVAQLNPILERKEEAAQKAARETTFADYVALSEELRQVKLDALLAAGVRYVQATEDVFRVTLDRVAREELGVPREKLRVPDLGRLYKAPKLAQYFDKALELKVLEAPFLAAQGRPRPTDADLAAVLRRLALKEMMGLRRYAFAKIAYELRLHGRPAAEIAPAAALLSAPGKAGDLRELYRQLFSVAYTFELSEPESQLFRTDVDDTFYAADYSRAFALAGMMHESIRRRFGEDWYGNKEVGKVLRSQLFSAGTSLSSEEVAVRLGFPAGVDFDAAAARARRLVSEADALEKAK